MMSNFKTSNAPPVPTSDPTLKLAAWEREYIESLRLANSTAKRHFLNRTVPTQEDDFTDAWILGWSDSILRTIQRGKPIVVVGSFNCDAILALVIIVGVLRRLGANVSWYMPDYESYYLKGSAWSNVQRKYRNTSLIINLDNGICSKRFTKWATDKGARIIQLDKRHIIYKASLRTPYPNTSQYSHRKQSCGALAFELMQWTIRHVPTWNLGVYISERLEEVDEDYLRTFEALVAIGTVAARVRLDELENRALVWRGLEALRRMKHLWFDKLLEAAGIDAEAIDAQTLRYGIVPLIDSASNRNHVDLAIELLLTKDDAIAEQHASTLVALNSERETRFARMAQATIASLKATGDYRTNSIVAVESPGDFDSPLATLLAEHFQRPALVLQSMNILIPDDDWEYWVGVARSPANIDLFQAFKQAADHVHYFGGYTDAVEFSITSAEPTDLITALSDYFGRLTPTDVLAGQTARPGAEIALNKLDWPLYESLQVLEPTGEGNPGVRLMTKGVEVVASSVQTTRGGLDLSFDVLDHMGNRFPCIGRGMGHRANEFLSRIDITYNLERDMGRDSRRLRLRVLEMKPSNEETDPLLAE